MICVKLQKEDNEIKYFRLYGRKWHIQKGQSVHQIGRRSAERGIEASTEYLIGYCGAAIRDSVFCRERRGSVHEMFICKKCLREYKKQNPGQA